MSSAIRLLYVEDDSAQKTADALAVDKRTLHNRLNFPPDLAPAKKFDHD